MTKQMPRMKPLMHNRGTPLEWSVGVTSTISDELSYLETNLLLNDILHMAFLSINKMIYISREFRSGVPCEDLYADDLVIIAESLEECVRRLLT